LFDLLDTKLALDHVSAPELHRALVVAMLCIQPTPSRRPSMSSVLAMLLGEEKTEIVMRLPHISNSDQARLLDLSSPFASPSKIPLLHLKTVPESTPGASNELDVSELQPR